MSTSYVKKLLRATLTLSTAVFPGTNNNTLTLVGYRTLATLQGAAGEPYALDLTIFGMRQSDMNAVTVLWQPAPPAIPTAINATALIQLEASSDDGQSWAKVFEGNFIDAQPDYNNAPNVGLHIVAMTGYSAQVQSAPPTVYRAAASVVSIAQYLAKQMGFTLEVNGVTGSLSTPYFSGSYMDQFRALCQHANLDFYFDGSATLAITPKNQPRQGKAVPVLSPSSGLRGFPTMQRNGLHVEALFTPALVLGGEIQVAGSIVLGANGTWSPYAITHNLEALQPDGAWFSRMDCTAVLT